jgi:hypothetical protein
MEGAMISIGGTLKTIIFPALMIPSIEFALAVELKKQPPNKQSCATVCELRLTEIDDPESKRLLNTCIDAKLCLPLPGSNHQV